MAVKVAGEKYESITGQLFEIGRQLRQPNGYPFELAHLQKHLQEAIEGKFGANQAFTRHIIDLDAPPKPYNGWEVVKHKKGGQFEWDPTKICLFLHPLQQGTKTVQGEDLQKKLSRSSTHCFNANMLEYLLEHPELIPEEWKKDENGNTRYIFFHDTVYRDSSGNRCVRYLYWDDGRWQAVHGWLDSVWDSRDPSAVRA